MKEFKVNEKSQILAMAKFLYQNYTSKREKVESQLAVVRDKFDFEGKLNEYRVKLEEQYNKRTEKLRQQIDTYKEQEDAMSAPIRSLILEDHPIYDIVTVGYKQNEDGSRRLVASFKYPDSILPPTDNLSIEEPEETAEEYSERNAGAVAPVDEGPEYDGAGFNGSDGELQADMEQERLADEARADAMRDCEDRKPDIDVDMQGEFKPIEEGPAIPDMDAVMHDVDQLVDAAAELKEKYPVQAAVEAEPAPEEDYNAVDQFAADTAEKFNEAVEHVVSQMPATEEPEEELPMPEADIMNDDDTPWDDFEEAPADNSNNNDDEFSMF